MGVSYKDMKMLKQTCLVSNQMQSHNLNKISQLKLLALYKYILYFFLVNNITLNLLCLVFKYYSLLLSLLYYCKGYSMAYSCLWGNNLDLSKFFSNKNLVVFLFNVSMVKMKHNNANKMTVPAFMLTNLFLTYFLYLL